MASGYGVGASLASYGQGQKTEAMKVLGEAAREEEQRNTFNTKMEAERKAGNQQLGATGGAMIGSSFGPWGTLIGGLLGAVAGGSF